MWIWLVFCLVVAPRIPDVDGEVTIVARSVETDTCGPEGVQCHKHATCHQGKCCCNAGFEGDGICQCRNKDVIDLTVTSTRIRLTGYQGQSTCIPANVPCFLKVTKLRTKGSGGLESCETEVSVMKKIVRGKQVLQGAELCVVTTDIDGNVQETGIRWNVTSIGQQMLKLDRIIDDSICPGVSRSKRESDSSDFDMLDGSGSGDSSFQIRSARFTDDEDYYNQELWEDKRDIDLGAEMNGEFEEDGDIDTVLVLGKCGVNISFVLMPSCEEGGTLSITAHVERGLFRNATPHKCILAGLPHFEKQGERYPESECSNQSLDPSFPSANTHLTGKMVGDNAKNSDQVTAAETFLFSLYNAPQQDVQSLQGRACQTAIGSVRSFCGQGNENAKVCSKLLQCTSKDDTNDIIESLCEDKKDCDTIMTLVGQCLRGVCGSTVTDESPICTNSEIKSKCSNHIQDIYDGLKCPALPDITGSRRRKRSRTWP